MIHDFNADEIFLMAEQMERNGAIFYRNAVEKVVDGAHKALLLQLANMEDEHKQTFAEMRASLADSEKAKNVFDPKNESIMYLKSLADTKVFFQKKINTSSIEDILKEAIQAEKDSIVFYIGMKEMVPGKMGKDRLEEIIQEEMMHIRLISRELVACSR